MIEHRVGSHAEAPPASDQPVAVRRGDELLAYEDSMPLNPEDILVCVRHVGDHIRASGPPRFEVWAATPSSTGKTSEREGATRSAGSSGGLRARSA